MMDYIPINTIEDIDPERISIRDINKRYIDREGNRYATRFNFQTRKIEVVRIVKGRSEAIRMRKTILRDKHEERALQRGTPDIGDLTDSSEEVLYQNDDDAGYTNRIAFDPMYEELLTACIQEAIKFKDSTASLLNLMKKVKWFETNEELQQLNREVDVQCWQKIDELNNYQKELYHYAKTSGFYLPRLGDDEKEAVSGLASEDDKIKLIRQIEMKNLLQEIFPRLTTFCQKVVGILHSMGDSEIRTIPAAQQQFVSDAKVLAEGYIRTCEARFKQLSRKS